MDDGTLTDIRVVQSLKALAAMAELFRIGCMSYVVSCEAIISARESMRLSAVFCVISKGSDVRCL